VESSLGRRLVPLHRPIHDTVVGHREMMDAECARPRDVLVDPSHAVEQRVLGVEMEMRELGHFDPLGDRPYPDGNR
jgi:hypothetical protein